MVITVDRAQATDCTAIRMAKFAAIVLSSLFSPSGPGYSKEQEQQQEQEQLSSCLDQNRRATLETPDKWSRASATAMTGLVFSHSSPLKYIQSPNATNLDFWNCCWLPPYIHQLITDRSGRLAFSLSYCFIQTPGREIYGPKHLGLWTITKPDTSQQNDDFSTVPFWLLGPIGVDWARLLLLTRQDRCTRWTPGTREIIREFTYLFYLRTFL